MAKTKITKTKLSHIISIPQILDEGFLCFVEGKNIVPFDIKRIYYIFDVKKNAVRGHHAHKKTLQVLFCVRGTITIKLNNGKRQELVRLTKPNQGIFLDKMMWHEMMNFTKDTMLLVLASEYYDEKDYIRNYADFLSYFEPKKNLEKYILPFPTFRSVMKGINL